MHIGASTAAHPLIHVTNTGCAAACGNGQKTTVNHQDSTHVACVLVMTDSTRKQASGNMFLDGITAVEELQAIGSPTNPAQFTQLTN